MIYRPVQSYRARAGSQSHVPQVDPASRMALGLAGGPQGPKSSSLGCMCLAVERTISLCSRYQVRGEWAGFDWELEDII
jgi:hypothetical protein